MKRVASSVSLLLMSCLPAVALGDPLKIAGMPVEIVISQVTDRTARVDIVPLDEQGRAKPTPPSVVLEKFSSTEKARIRDLKDSQQVKVGSINVSVTANPIVIKFQKPDGKLIQELTVKDADGSIVFHTDAPTVGLGEGRQQFDRRGYYFNFQNGQNQFLDTHGATMPVPFLIGTDGWGMFIHNPPPAGTPRPNTAWGQFDMRGADAGPPPVFPQNAGGRGRGAATAPGTATASAPSRGQILAALLTPPDPRPTRGRFVPRQDTLNQAPTSIFIMNLDQPANAFGEYTHLFGHALMPPKWVMGYMQSHRSIAGPEEVMAVAKRLRDDKLPCDALIYLGTGYTIATQGNEPLGGWNMRNGRLDFNPAIFPKPQEMVDELHAMNFKIILHKTNAPAGLHGDLYDKNPPPEDMTHVANYWSKPGQGLNPDMTPWQDTTSHTTLMNMGVDAWWPDDGDELPIENRLARIKVYYEGPLKDRANERPWSLNRNGYAGVAKYGGWNWSGDVTSRWATLAAHVPVGVQFSLSVSPWWGTDIGGFVGAPEYSGELYVRWFQFAVFNPLFRSHGRNWRLHTPFGWNTGDAGPREGVLPAADTLEAELHNPAVEPACKAALELRYQLLPYNYTITREACDTGMPPMPAALLLSYPNDATAVSLGDEYLWGPNMLVAPVVEKGAKERKVYLPEGQWYDYASGAKQSGKQWITRAVDINTIPVYVKAGAIIPMDPVRQFTAEKVSEPTTLHVYPGASGTFTLYDDDGHTQGYLDGSDKQTQWIRISWDDAAKKLSLDPDPRMKQWPAGTTRAFKVQIGNAGATKQVDFKGTHVEVNL